MPVIQLRDLFGIAIEHERLAALEFADAPLAGLGPARMIDLRVDIGVETVFVRAQWCSTWWRAVRRPVRS